MPYDWQMFIDALAREHARESRARRRAVAPPVPITAEERTAALEAKREAREDRARRRAARKATGR